VVPWLAGRSRKADFLVDELMNGLKMAGLPVKV
jgi:hypothetical protein